MKIPNKILFISIFVLTAGCKMKTVSDNLLKITGELRGSVWEASLDDHTLYNISFDRKTPLMTLTARFDTRSYFEESYRYKVADSERAVELFLKEQYEGDFSLVNGRIAVLTLFFEPEFSRITFRKLS